MVTSVSSASASTVSSVMSSGSSTTAESSGTAFAAMLAQATQPCGQEKNSALASSIKSDFEKWEQTFSNQGISSSLHQDMEKYSAAFEDIVDRAAAQGGYNDPQAFLKTLSASDLKVLQKVHSLADPINPDGLTKEGALNLLYAPDQTQDIDKDGYEMVGVAKDWRFPPPDAPESVKTAWDKTVSGMSGSGALLLASTFLPPVDRQTGQAANDYLGPNTDYVALARKALEGAIFSSQYDQPWQTENRAREIEGLSTFLTNLQSA